MNVSLQYKGVKIVKFQFSLTINDLALLSNYKLHYANDKGINVDELEGFLIVDTILTPTQFGNISCN